MTKHCGFYWVEENRLGGSAYPSACLEWLYKVKGIRAILSLEPLKSEEVKAAKSMSIQCETVAIKDYTAGTSEQREKALMIIDKFLSKDLPTLVHCQGGLGRTGMVLALYLVRRKALSPKNAIARIRALRPGSIELDTGQKEAIEQPISDIPKDLHEWLVKQGVPRQKAENEVKSIVKQVGCEASKITPLSPNPFEPLLETADKSDWRVRYTMIKSGKRAAKGVAFCKHGRNIIIWKTDSSWRFIFRLCSPETIRTYRTDTFRGMIDIVFDFLKDDWVKAFITWDSIMGIPTR